jgi:hypothetical protein
MLLRDVNDFLQRGCWCEHVIKRARCRTPCLRETYITGAQSAFEQARDVTVADIVEAIDL